MKRTVSKELDAWLADPLRKPLVVRGARQVGKTWLVRDLAARSGLDLVELNFERDPSLARVFASNRPRRILDDLALLLNREIEPGKCLLFLDEIQAHGEILAALRWFLEELPGLAVAAAGSLLEFVLADHAFSMPVGRVSFLHVEPMNVAEYLLAHGQERLLKAISGWAPRRTLSTVAHEQASAWFERYAMVGGMPGVVAAEVSGSTPRHIRRLQLDLMATYRADFAKYSGRMDRNLLDGLLLAVARSIGRKFVYAHVGQGIKQHQAKAALERLADARLCHLIEHSAANGLPLAAEAKPRFRKATLLDVGLLHALQKTPAGAAFPPNADLAPTIRGQLADQLVAQQLRTVLEPFGDGPRLHYWQRDGGRPGEIDFLVELAGTIVPLEVKAGAAGSMKSLHQFMHDKKLKLAVRCDTNPPSVMDLDLRTTKGQPVAYRLLSIPAYLCWRVGDLVAKTQSDGPR